MTTSMNSIVTDDIDFHIGLTSFGRRACYRWNEHFKLVLLSDHPVSSAAHPTASRLRLTFNLHGEGVPVSAQLWRIRGGRCRLSCQSKRGRLSLFLPRDFHGFIRIEADSPTSLSSALLDRSALLSDREGVKKYFVGEGGGRGTDPEGRERESRRWRGDELKVLAGAEAVSISLAGRLSFVHQL